MPEVFKQTETFEEVNESEEEFDEQQALVDAGLEEASAEAVDSAEQGEEGEQAEEENSPQFESVEEAVARIRELEKAQAGLRDDLVRHRQEAARNAQLQAKLDMINERLAGGEQQYEPEDPEIDPEVDPAGALAQKIERGDKETRRSIDEIKQQLAIKQQVEEGQRFATELQSAYEKAKESIPDLDSAIAHQLERRKAIMRYQGDGLTEEQIDMILDRDTIDFYEKSRAAGRNPFEAIYELAKDGFSYLPQKVEEKNEKVTAAEAKVREKKERMASAKTIASATGSTPRTKGVTLTLDDVADMSDDELDALFKGPNKEQILERLEVEGEVRVPG